MISQIYPLGHFILAIAELFLIGWSIRLSISITIALSEDGTTV